MNTLSYSTTPSMLLNKQSTLWRHRTRELAESALCWVGSVGEVKITKDDEPMPRTSLVTKTARFLTSAPPRVGWGLDRFAESVESWARAIDELSDRGVLS